MDLGTTPLYFKAAGRQIVVPKSGSVRFFDHFWWTMNWTIGPVQAKLDMEHITSLIHFFRSWMKLTFCRQPSQRIRTEPGIAASNTTPTSEPPFSPSPAPDSPSPVRSTGILDVVYNSWCLDPWSCDTVARYFTCPQPTNPQPLTRELVPQKPFVKTCFSFLRLTLISYFRLVPLVVLPHSLGQHLPSLP